MKMRGVVRNTMATATAERKLARGVDDGHMPTYAICVCNAWCSVGYDHYFKSYGDRCYMCHRALYADMPEVEVKTTVLFKNRKRSQVLCVGWLPPDQRQFPGKKIRNGCGRKLSVSELTYIQTFWYTEPHGCTEGDYWNMGEGQFVCPHCGEVNRLDQRQDVEALKPYFKDVIEKHDR